MKTLVGLRRHQRVIAPEGSTSSPNVAIAPSGHQSDLRHTHPDPKTAQWALCRGPLWEHQRMKSDDDPEARIRELERPLADQASRSEQFAPPPGDYGYQPPPVGNLNSPPAMPPQFHGSTVPYFSPARKASSFPWWIIVGLIVVAGGAFAVGVAVFSVGLFSGARTAITSSPSSISTMTPPSRTAPPGSGSQTPGSAGPTIPPAGGRLSVAGVSVNRTLICNDSVVDVSGFSNTVAITGHCANVTVSGVGNVVSTDDADVITASGVNNRVTFHSGSPRVNNSGTSNVVEQG
jgi:hypothetical protein